MVISPQLRRKLLTGKKSESGGTIPISKNRYRAAEVFPRILRRQKIVTHDPSRC
jgi:hypothetical protein